MFITYYHRQNFVVTLGAHARGLQPSARMRSEGYCSRPVCVCVRSVYPSVPALAASASV